MCRPHYLRLMQHEQQPRKDNPPVLRNLHINCDDNSNLSSENHLVSYDHRAWLLIVRNETWAGGNSPSGQRELGNILCQRWENLDTLTGENYIPIALFIRSRLCAVVRRSTNHLAFMPILSLRSQGFKCLVSWVASPCHMHNSLIITFVSFRLIDHTPIHGLWTDPRVPLATHPRLSTNRRGNQSSDDSSNLGKHLVTLLSLAILQLTKVSQFVIWIYNFSALPQNCFEVRHLSRYMGHNNPTALENNPRL